MDKDLTKRLGIKKPEKYMVRISKIGFDTMSFGLKGDITDKDSIEATMRVLYLLGDNWAKHDQGIFLYDVAISILARLNGYKEKDLLRHIKHKKKTILKKQNNKNTNK